MKRRLLVLGIGAAAVVAIVRFVNIGTFWSAVSAMPKTSLLGLILLLALNSVVKAGRLDIAWRDGMTSYLAGMAATALPGGSLLAPRLAQEHGTVTMHQATPALFVSAAADALAVSSLALLCTFVTDQERGRVSIPLIGLGFAALLILLGRSARLWGWVSRLLARYRWTRKWLPQEADVQRSIAAMLRLSVVAAGTLLSVVTTLLSIAFLVVLVNGLTFRGIRPGEAAGIHTMAETIGIVLPLSFGISIKGASLARMLNTLGIGWVRVVYVMLAMRSLNVLARTMLGSVVLAACYRDLLGSALALRRRTRVARHHGRRLARFLRGRQPSGTPRA